MNSREIVELRKKRALLLKEADEIKEKLENEGYKYNRYFSRSRSKEEFKLHKLPSNASLKAYLDFYDEYYKKHFNSDYYENHTTTHPLDWGYVSKFDFDELAVLIKMLYQFQTGKECAILKFGNAVEVPALVNVFPKFYYLIGTKPMLEKYAEYNGSYYEKLNKFNINKAKEGLIIIPETTDYRIFDSYNIRTDNVKTFEYYEYKYAGVNVLAVFDKYENIFKDNLKEISSKIKTHRDILVPKISLKDNFISNILYSIMIYKYNKNIKTLTDQDYNIIFNTLYHENVNSFSEQVTENTPKILTYVKDEKSREKFDDYRWKPSR